MSDAELEAIFRNAYRPYVGAFLDDPGLARLSFQFDNQSILATLTMAQADFDRFDQDVSLRAEQRRAFNNLVREWDNRSPALRFVARQ
jgi:hypothetical protein